MDSCRQPMEILIVVIYECESIALVSSIGSWPLKSEKGILC